MNYIKRLEQENEELRARGTQMARALNSLKATALYGPKFTGVDSNGDRKDWMSTSELAGHIDAILFAD